MSVFDLCFSWAAMVENHSDSGVATSCDSNKLTRQSKGYRVRGGGRWDFSLVPTPSPQEAVKVAQGCHILF